MIEQDGRIRRREIDLIDPCVFSSRLSLDEPGVVQEAAMFDERVEVESLCHPFERHLTVYMRGLLFLGRTLVVPEIVKTIPFKDGWMRQPRQVRKGVAIHTKFTLIPDAISDGFEETGTEKPTLVSYVRGRG